MSNGHRWRKVVKSRQPVAKTPLERYAAALAATGMPEREVARAYFYAEKYGLDKMVSPDDQCVVFDEPTCENWNCLNPEHQRLRYESL